MSKATPSEMILLQELMNYIEKECDIWLPTEARRQIMTYEDLLYEVLKNCESGKDFATIVAENSELSRFYKTKSRAIAKEIAAKKAAEETERLKADAIKKLTVEELEVLGLKKKTRSRRAAV